MRSIVVVGYDHTLAGGRALLAAGREAAYRKADVSIVNAYPTAAEARAGSTATARETSEATVAFGAGVLRHRYPALNIHGEALPGVPHEVLANAARAADLLVLGGLDADDIGTQQLDPVVAQTLARTPCPVMVVHATERQPRGIVVAALDLADPTEEVVNFAFAEARFHSAQLLAVAAWEPAGTSVEAGAGATLDRILDERKTRCGSVQVRGEVVDGPPVAVLAAAAARADLLVAGAHRRDGRRYGVKIGQVTETLLGRPACPVIIVPHL